MRSRYTRDALAAIAARFVDLAPDDQLGVLSDTRSLASIGDVPMADYLDLIRGFPPAVDPVVSSTLIGQLRDIDGLYDGLPGQESFRAFGRRLLAPLFAHVGWEARAGESANTAIVRADLIAALNDFGDTMVVEGVRERFQRYVDHPADFSADARHNLLRNVAVKADEKVWERLRQMARSANTELERQEFYGLLGAAEDKALVRRALDLVFSDEVETTTGPRIISRVSMRHPEMALDFSITNWDRLVKMLEAGSAHQFVPGLARYSADLKSIERLNGFAEARIPASARQDLTRAISRIRYQADVRTKRLPEVDRWLAARK
jgi:aminopeptidase N